MKTIHIEGTDLHVSNLIMGCMRIDSLSEKELDALMHTALEQGINLFDHADIYSGGRCEELFAKAVDRNPAIRQKLYLQSKCSICGGYYDFSKEHILEATDGILKRLHTDYLDILLLHRPDPLMEPEEVASAFERLHADGKVRYFGVSNQNPMQIELLQKYTRHKLIVNQLQMSVVHTPVLDSGIAVNMTLDQSIDRTGSIYEYSRLKGMTLQAWSPFQKGFFEGPFLLDRDKYGKLNEVIDRLAQKYAVTSTAIAVAWLTRLPANVQVILGTTKPQRLIDGCAGSDISLTRQEWYEMYTAAGNTLP
ncbi:MAG: aldo/keto reductase [Eubacteriales bacterium]|nr:aldo/keto reductase [Eubacteriales bacterium]